MRARLTPFVVLKVSGDFLHIFFSQEVRAGQFFSQKVREGRRDVARILPEGEHSPKIGPPVGPQKDGAP